MAVTAKNRAEATPEFSIGRFLREVFDELRKVVRKLDLKGIGREVVPLLRGGRRKRRR